MSNQILPSDPDHAVYRERIITTYLETPEGRAVLATAFTNAARTHLDASPEDKAMPDVAATRLRLIESFLRLKEKLDGTEAIDRVALFSTFGDLQAMHDQVRG